MMIVTLFVPPIKNDLKEFSFNLLLIQTYHPEWKPMEIGGGENVKSLPMTTAQFYEKKEHLREKIVR